VSSVSAIRERITQEQLETYTNNQIATYLTNNFKYITIKSNTDVIKFNYKFKTIQKMGSFYVLSYKSGTSNLNKQDWLNCLDLYSTAICKKNMITNYGTYGTTETKTVNQLTRETLIKEYNLIKHYRDYKETTENINLGGVTLE
jgi:hypothetical protein